MREALAERMGRMLSDGTFSVVSKVEDRLAEWLSEQGIPFQRQVRLFAHRVVDFMVAGTCVEVYGCYWHGCPQHFPAPTPRQRQRHSRDRALMTYCQRRAIPLLIIWEHDVRAGDFSALSSLLVHAASRSG